MKIIKTLLTLIFVMILSTTVYATNTIPYKTLYYDGVDNIYTADKINLNINGKLIQDSELPMQPINIDGARTLVPLREVFEELGATVEYYGETNTVIIKDGSNVVTLVVGSTKGTINGTEVIMDTAPKYVALDSVTAKKVMIPLRFVSEGLGYTVHYEPGSRTVYVKSETKPEPEIKPDPDLDLDSSGSGNGNTNGNTNNNGNNTNTGTDNTNITPKITLTQKNSSKIVSSSQKLTTVSELDLPTSVNKILTIDTSSAISNINIQDLGDGRLVIDIENAKYTQANVNQDMSIDTLVNVRVAQFAISPTYITRVVLTFKDDTIYSTNLSTDRKRFTLSFSSDDNLPVISNNGNNAKSVSYSGDGTKDTFTITGDLTPQLYSITPVDNYNLYIDIFKPNTIDDVLKNVNGVSVINYKISTLDDITTRLHVTLNGEYTYSKTETNNSVSISIRPKTDVENIVSVTQTDDVVTIKIKKDATNLPASYNLSSITHTDSYMNSKYTLTLPNSLSDYLGSSDSRMVNNNIVNNVNILSEKSSTKFVINGKKVLHASVTQDSTYLIFTIKAARDVYDKIIVIDPGHGGKDPGTVGTLNGTTYYEKNIVLDIGLKATSYINQKSNIKVYMTRTGDTTVELYDRPAFSTKLEADAFISIHANSSTSFTPNGIDTFYFDVSKEDTAYLAEKNIYVTDKTLKTTALSKSLAEQIQKNLIKATLLTDRGFKHGNYAVLRHNTSPSVLIETGFMSNQRDIINLSDDAYRTKVANSIADTVVTYFK